DVVVRVVEPEGVSLKLLIVAIGRAGQAHDQVTVETVIARGGILNADAGTVDVVDDIILDQAIVAVVEHDPPLMSLVCLASRAVVVDDVANERELVAIRLWRCRPNQIMYRHGSAIALIATRTAAQFAETGVLDVHVGSIGEQGVATCLAGVIPL